jgi:hypothetical protein
MNRTLAIGFGKLLNAVKAEDLAEFQCFRKSFLNFGKS